MREPRLEFLQWRTASEIEFSVSASNTLFPLPRSMVPVFCFADVSPAALEANFNLRHIFINTNRKYFWRARPNLWWLDPLPLLLLWAKPKETGVLAAAHMRPDWCLLLLLRENSDLVESNEKRGGNGIESKSKEDSKASSPSWVLILQRMDMSLGSNSMKASESKERRRL